MFDIGFFELVVVGIVSLVVLGPEKLPGTIRTVSLWIGRLRRSFNNIKSEIEKEVGADEIRRQLRNEEIMEKFRNTQNKVQNSIQSIKSEADEFKKNIDLEAHAASFKDSLTSSIDSKPAENEKSIATESKTPANSDSGQGVEHTPPPETPAASKTAASDTDSQKS